MVCRDSLLKFLITNFLLSVHVKKTDTLHMFTFLGIYSLYRSSAFTSSTKHIQEVLIPQVDLKCVVRMN